MHVDIVTCEQRNLINILATSFYASSSNTLVDNALRQGYNTYNFAAISRYYAYLRDTRKLQDYLIMKMMRQLIPAKFR